MAADCHPITKIILPLIRVLSAFAIIFCTYLYVKAQRGIKNRILFYSGLLLFCIQAFMLLTYGINNAFFHCDGKEEQSETWRRIQAIPNSLIIIQLLVIFFILFFRLKVVFDDTMYQLSRCTIITFSTIYSSCGILTVFATFTSTLNGGTRVTDSVWYGIAVMFSGMLLLCTIVALSVLFIYKLIKVYKGLGTDVSTTQYKLVSMVTKMSLLLLVSILSSIVLVITSTLYGNSAWDWWHWTVVRMGINIDIWCNFLTVFLTYKCFENFYFRICGYCDGHCRRLCGKIMGVTEIKMMTLHSVDSIRFDFTKDSSHVGSSASSELETVDSTQLSREASN